jgi:hypothetical protein
MSRSRSHSPSVSGWPLQIQISKHWSPLADLSKLQSFDGFRGRILSVRMRSSPASGMSPISPARKVPCGCGEYNIDKENVLSLSVILKFFHVFSLLRVLRYYNICAANDALLICQADKQKPCPPQM